MKYWNSCIDLYNILLIHSRGFHYVFTGQQTNYYKNSMPDKHFKTIMNQNKMYFCSTPTPLADKTVSIFFYSWSMFYQRIYNLFVSFMGKITPVLHTWHKKLKLHRLKSCNYKEALSNKVQKDFFLCSNQVTLAIYQKVCSIQWIEKKINAKKYYQKISIRMFTVLSYFEKIRQKFQIFMYPL